jgi:hypothetical protein
LEAEAHPNGDRLDSRRHVTPQEQAS